MSGHGILKYFSPITSNKDITEDKDSSEGKELSGPLSKVIPLSSVANCNAEVLSKGTRLNKQNGLLLKNFYTKLTLAQR